MQYKHIINILACKKDIVNLYYEILENPIVETDYNKIKLKFLEEKGLVYSLSNNNNEKYYYPIEPKISWNALLLKYIWDRGFILYDIEFNNNIPFKYRSFLKKTKKIIKELCLKYSNNQTNNNIITSLNSKEQISTNLTKLIMDTKESIKVINYYPYLLGENTWLAITEQLKKGVSYERISNKNELFVHGLKVTENEIKLGEILFYMQKNDDIDKFYLFDNEIVLIINIDNNNLTGQIIKNKALINMYERQFDLRKKESIDAASYISYIKKNIKEKIKNIKLSNRQIKILNYFINTGKYVDENYIHKHYSDIKCLLKKNILVEKKNIIIINEELL